MPQFGPSSTIDDVFDGTLYQEKMAHFKLREADIYFSLSISTDGVQVFKSSTKSMWPVWLRINELPPSIRYLEIFDIRQGVAVILRFYSKYKILAGQWVGKRKPPMLWFLKPCANELNELAVDGLSFYELE